MNLLEELRSLDPREPGRWPLPVRAGAVGVAFLALTLLGIYFLVWKGRRPELKRLQEGGRRRRRKFTTNQPKPATFRASNLQLKATDRPSARLRRQLPART